MLSETIHILRMKRGVSTQELGDAIGVSSEAVDQYEANKWLPGTPILQKMAQYFGVSVDALRLGYCMGYDEESREILLIQNISGNRIKIVARVKDELD